jgi:hypothetical protein
MKKIICHKGRPGKTIRLLKRANRMIEPAPAGQALTEGKINPYAFFVTFVLFVVQK